MAADGITVDDLEEDEPEALEHCEKCNGSRKVPVLRCPRKLLASTDVPDFLSSYHDWKKDGTLPVGTARGDQALVWIAARNLFDRWVEDTMKTLRDAEAARAKSKARSASAGR
jgi:hypothetical protein